MPRPPVDIDPDWLRERFTMPGATALEIAAETGHHVSTVRSHARRFGIRMWAPWPDRSEFDEAWLRRRYVDDKAKISDIAAEAGVYYSTVQKAIERSGLFRTGVIFRRGLQAIEPTLASSDDRSGSGDLISRSLKAASIRPSS